MAEKPQNWDTDPQHLADLASENFYAGRQTQKTAQTQYILAPCAHKQATHIVGQKLSDFINLTPWKAGLQTGQFSSVQSLSHVRLFATP